MSYWMKSKLARFRRSVWCVYIALNMLCVSILFFPWSRERETFSSIVGRSVIYEGPIPPCVAEVLEWFIDLIHRDEGHCLRTFMEEQEVRDVWYGRD
jgi:hypothetical protein